MRGVKVDVDMRFYFGFTLKMKNSTWINIFRPLLSDAGQQLSQKLSGKITFNNKVK